MYNQIKIENNIIGDIMIREIMTYNIISGDKESSIKEISSLMKKHNVGFIPIKNKDEYIGVITDRDICLAIPTINNINDSIKSYITNNIIYIDVNSDINNALKIMGRNKVKRLLVKDEKNIIGVLSLSDILNYTNNKNIISTYKTIFYIHDNDKSTIAEIDEFYL